MPCTQTQNIQHCLYTGCVVLNSVINYSVLIEIIVLRSWVSLIFFSFFKVMPDFCVQ